MRVLVTQELPEPSTTDLLAGHEVVIGIGDPASAAAAPLLAGADALLPTPRERVSSEVLARAPHLAIVANCAVGTDNIDLQACARRGVVVTNTPDVLTEATADLTWALLLAVARRIREGEKLLRSGTWTGWKPTELLGISLEGKTLGVWGGGRIGRAVARRGEAFGMRILAMRSADPRARFEELLESSDVLSLHAPATAATRGRFSRAELFRMKKGAILVNTARGALLDEDALADALEAGRLRGAGLDVYRDEPRVSPRLLARDDVVLLPHIGSATEETRLAMARIACGEIARVLRGEAPLHRVV
ncbi:MAG TPA: D-glycerate dehydrogenase [Thermoanaerobaculia bacterium]|nr:D-glycerate dehydrogenase [Thermoanaerobaculia bacterium]